MTTVTLKSSNLHIVHNVAALYCPAFILCYFIKLEVKYRKLEVKYKHINCK